MSASAFHPPAKVEKHLSVPRKIAYGISAPLDTWGVWIPVTLASPVFTMQLGISPWIVSLLFMSWRLWDAVTDPVMGWISDNTHTRWGRRRPYIFVGAILMGLLFPLMWMFPRDAGQGLILAWVAVSGVLLYSALTVWSMPYQSLFIELTPDYHERTRINTYRFFFSTTLGMLIGWSWWLTQLEIFHDPVTGQPDTLNGARYVTAGVGVLMIIVGIMPALFVKERFAQSKVVTQHKKTSLLSDLKLTLSNRKFLILVVVTLAFVSGTALVQNFFQFIGTYYVFDGDTTMSSKYGGYSQTCYTTGVLLALVAVNYISPRWGKRKTVALMLFMQLIGCAANFFIYVPGMPILQLINPLFMGFGGQGTWLLIGSMVADVVDEDELATEARREGSYSSIFSWVVKMAFTVGFGLSGTLVEMTGFDVARGPDQLEVFFRMKLVMSVLPVTALAIGIWLLTRYDITEQTAAETRRKLEERRGVV